MQKYDNEYVMILRTVTIIHPNRTSIEGESMCYPPLNSSFCITSIDSHFSVCCSEFRSFSNPTRHWERQLRQGTLFCSRRGAYCYKASIFATLVCEFDDFRVDPDCGFPFIPAGIPTVYIIFLCLHTW